MNDGRETYVQFDIFLFPFVILLNIIFEISINPSLTLYQKYYSLSLMKSIDLKDRERKKFLYPYPKKKNDISSESRYLFNV